jgi:cell division protein ZapA (FtsZ GTPase activity inhibitor)
MTRVLKMAQFSVVAKKVTCNIAEYMGTEVKILGKTFEVKSQFDPDFTMETANLVNIKMNELAGKAATISTEKVAILAAMNIAGDYLRLKRSETNRRNALMKKIEKIVDFVQDKEKQFEKQREVVEARK